MSEHVRIDGIELVNFRNHEKLAIELKDLNVILGENGGGKSSILEAISYALFGVVASGAKKSELIRYGQKSGYVALKLSNGYTLMRDFLNGVRLVDADGNIITEKAAEVESYFNIDKNVFMNILYASQNDVYSYFVKFNAKEKDFVDSMFNIDSMTDNIAFTIKNLQAEMERDRSRLASISERREMLERSITDILSECEVQDIASLERALDVAKSNLQSVNERQRQFSQLTSLTNKRIEIQNAISYAKRRIEELTKSDIVNTAKEAKKRFLDCISKYSQELNFAINIDDLQGLYDAMDENCSISTHLNDIRANASRAMDGINDQQLVLDALEHIVASVDIIGQLDDYRKYYGNIRNIINELRTNALSAIRAVKVSGEEINKLNEQIRHNQEMLDSVNERIERLNNAGISDNLDTVSEMIRQYQARETSLSTTLRNLRSYQTQLQTIDEVDEGRMLGLKNAIELIDKVSPLFGRDGFVSYLRKSILREIANNIGNSLEHFGFTKLLPVSVDAKSGSLVFNERPFRSLSGGEKTIAAILLRVLYAKLLAPSMRLNILILDEPTADLDGTRVGHLRQMLNDINRTFGTQIIVVTHDEQVIPEGCNIINVNVV